MKTEIRLSGSGGQGVILASVIIGKAAALYEGKYGIQSQSYGPEARGGATKSDVIISDEPILYPKARNIDYLISLTQKSLEKFLPTLKKGGTLIVDSDFVTVDDEKVKDFKVYKLPLSSTTLEKQGRLIAMNVVAIGAFVTISKILSFDSIKKSVVDSAPKGTEDFNLQALEIGKELAEKSL